MKNIKLLFLLLLSHVWGITAVAYRPRDVVDIESATTTPPFPRWAQRGPPGPPGPPDSPPPGPPDSPPPGPPDGPPGPHALQDLQAGTRILVAETRQTIGKNGATMTSTRTTLQSFPTQGWSESIGST